MGAKSLPGFHLPRWGKREKPNNIAWLWWEMGSQSSPVNISVIPMADFMCLPLFGGPWGSLISRCLVVGWTLTLPTGSNSFLTNSLNSNIYTSSSVYLLELWDQNFFCFNKRWKAIAWRNLFASLVGVFISHLGGNGGTEQTEFDWEIS